MRKKIYFNLFIVSFVIMGLEMTATRFIAPSFGNTVYTWGIIISVFLIGSSIGYLLGGYIADKKSRNTIMLLFYFFGILTIAFIPMLKNNIFPYLDTFSSILGTTLGVIILYFVPNLLFSSIATILMTTGLDEGVSGRIVGNLHTTSAIGSVLGTLVTTFGLIPLTNINSVISIFVCMTFIASLFYFETKKTMHTILLIFPVLFVFLPQLSKTIETSNILYQNTSLYHDINVYQTDFYGGNTGEYRYLSFGNRDTIQGVMDMKNPDSPILDYAKNIWEISNIYAKDSDSVFIIGHGIGTLTRLYEEEKEVKVAEIDKEVLEVSRNYFQYDGQSVEIGDGRSILNHQKNLFDIIVLDAYNNTKQIPFHLISKEFFSLTREKLNQDGILVINAIGTPQNDMVIESINATLKSVYPTVLIFGTEADNKQQNLSIVASLLPLDPNKVQKLIPMQVKNGEIILDEETKLNNLN
ncbi:fused MFS/spermidine synthase [Peribacillus asahii]|uniref:fused MFS/spermidine synthase n=1 Tax=Peribacillus asahii TaxID=228899 RepID=UPI00207A9861|nr:fused MFS/spermidine synthase [Peribacillus asahii]USK62406.1 fused MFS/spermidine synthase [Peribacillus asahii]